MRHFIKLFLLALAFLSSQAWGNPVDAMKTLTQIAPTKQWNAQNAIEVDIDCDNQKDYVFLSQADSKVTIGMVMGRDLNKAYLSEITMRDDKKEVCLGTATILAESMDYEPKFVTGKSVEGFKRSQCLAFRLSAGQCESYHFFWNTQHNRPAWWRWSK